MTGAPHLFCLASMRGRDAEHFRESGFGARQLRQECLYFSCAGLTVPLELPPGYNSGCCIALNPDFRPRCGLSPAS